MPATARSRPSPASPISRRGRSSPSSTATSSARATRRRPSPSRCATGGAASARPKRSATRSRRTTSSSSARPASGRPRSRAGSRKLAGAPFVKVEASKFTEVGYVGRDVEAMVRDLVESAIDMVRTERESGGRGPRAREASTSGCSTCCFPCPPTRSRDARRRPQPAPSRPRARRRRGGVFVVSPTGDVQQERDADAAQERYKRTREKLKQLLLDGQLEEREVEIEVTQQRRRCST